MSAKPAPTVSADDLTATAQWWTSTAPKYQASWFVNGAPNEQAARRALDQMIERDRKEVARLSEAVRQKQMSVDDWHVAVALSVKRCHIAALALARGGVSKVRVSDLADD